MATKMLKNVQKTAQQMVTNKYVLYTVLCLSIINILGFLITNNFVGLAVFALIGLLVSYFTKNMTTILLVTLGVSSFLHISRMTVEAMTNKKDASTKKSKKDKKIKEGMTDDFEDAAPVDNDDNKQHTCDICGESFEKKELLNKHMKDDHGKDDHGKDDHENDSDDEDNDSGNESDDKELKQDKPVTMKKKKNTLNHQATIQESYNNIHGILGNKNFQKMTKDTKKLLEQQNKLTESLNTMAPILENAQSMLSNFDMKQMGGMLDSLNLGPASGKKKKN
jgi:hypothetical protein